MQQLPVRQLAELCAGPVAPVLLDVREPWEFELASIQLAGADTLHIPMGEIMSRFDEIDAARRVGDVAARPIVCICHHGMRSAQVVAFLERQGWAPVYNLAGGIEAWSTEVDAGVPRY